MKAIKIDKFGSTEVLSYGYEPRPSAGEKEVVIRIKAIGVGRVDISAREGLYAPLQEPGFIPGIEVAGEVITVGEHTPADWIGKRVFARLFKGGYAEEVSVPFSSLVEVPEEITDVQAVAFGINALVASFSLELADLNKNDHLLIRGATGGIGSIAAIFASSYGFNVTAELQSDRKRDRLEAIGISQFLKPDDIIHRKASYKSIIDLVLGKGLDPYINLLVDRGHYIISGGAAGSPEQDFGMSFLTRVHQSLNLHVFSLNTFSEKEVNIRMTDLFTLISERSLIAPVYEILSLKDAAKAHDLLASGDVFGKIVLVNQD